MVITTWIADMVRDAAVRCPGVGSGRTIDCASTLNIEATVVMQAHPTTGEIYTGITRAMQVL